MNTRFQDLEHERNPRNGEILSDGRRASSLLEDLHDIKPPFMCQFIGENGFGLTIGLSGNVGCVQHSANDGAPPYLMATDPTRTKAGPDVMEFAVGGTATPIDGRYCLPFPVIKEVVGEFVDSGSRSKKVEWQEFH